MKKKLDIPKKFWKDFKDRKDFNEFFSELFKEGINQMLKAVYLAIGNIERKWTMPIRNWGMILQQFLIRFEDRCRI